jgi:peptidoglycan hydrolase-like protein with peptidoglycan-binding domain
MPNTASAVLNLAQAQVGVSGRPNKYATEYAAVHGSEFRMAAWCLMFIMWVAHHAGAFKALAPAGDRAYTPWYADDWAMAGKWYSGTVANIKAHAEPGDPILFDWSGTNDRPAVDHVAFVKKNLSDGRVITIEGNTGGGEGSVLLRVRGADVIAGFGKGMYDKETPVVIPLGAKWPYAAGTLMRKGWENSTGVKKVQGKINGLGYSPKLMADGDFGTKTEKAVMWYQDRNGLMDDGIVGPITWAHLFANERG